MESIFSYMLKISLSYATIYLFYLALLKPITHYKSIRSFLLISSLLAFCIPMLRLNLFLPVQIINSSSFVNSIPSVTVNATPNVFIPAEGSLNIQKGLMLLFVTGILIFLLRLIMQLWSLKKIRASAQLVDTIKGIKLYHLKMNIIPFSFGKAIYCNRNLHSENELKEIIKHESVHIHQKHTLDVMIAEFTCILNWYNPFVWLIKHSIKQNLEFLADDAVIRNGTEKKSYQYLLLKVVGHSSLTITSSLNFSSLKQRIYMMNKTKNSRRHMFKFLFIIPAIVLMIVAFRDTSSQKKIGNTKAVNPREETFRLSELSYSIIDPDVAMIIKKEQNKSLLQVGKPFSISLIKEERDRLKSLLEKNGYNQISNHSISFLIDSSSTNNSFSVQVNINLQAKGLDIGNNDNRTTFKKSNAIIIPSSKYHSTLLINSFGRSLDTHAAAEHQITIV
jgi:hypothetical protein